MGSGLGKAIEASKSRGGDHLVLDKLKGSSIVVGGGGKDDVEKLWAKVMEELPELTRVTINGCRLPQLPSSLGAQARLRGLMLEDNALSSLDNVDFAGLVALEELFLDNNELHEFPHALHCLTRLTALSLNSNRLGAGPQANSDAADAANSPGTLPRSAASRKSIGKNLDKKVGSVRERPKSVREPALEQPNSGRTRKRSLTGSTSSGGAPSATPPAVRSGKLDDILDAMTVGELKSLKSEISDRIKALSASGARTAAEGRVGPAVTSLAAVAAAAAAEAHLGETEVVPATPRAAVQAKLPRLKLLNLADNKMACFPPALQAESLTALEKVQLSGNRMARLPRGIERWQDLSSMNISHNIFRTLPDAVCALVGLMELFAYNNQLRELPTELGNLTRLKTLDVSQNKLTHLPDSIAALSSLKSLLVQNNELTELTDADCRLPNLNVLSVGHNKLTHLPAGVSTMTNLTELSLESNNLTTLPAELAKIPTLRKISADFNSISELPYEFRALTNLQTLTLEGNDLTELPIGILSLKIYRFTLDDNPLAPDAQKYVRKNGSLALLRANQRTLGAAVAGSLKKQPPAVEWVPVFKLVLQQMGLPEKRRAEMEAMKPAKRFTLVQQSGQVLALNMPSRARASGRFTVDDPQYFTQPKKTLTPGDASKLRVSLQTRPIEWVEQFVSHDGLKRLADELKTPAGSGAAAAADREELLYQVCASLYILYKSRVSGVREAVHSPDMLQPLSRVLATNVPRAVREAVTLLVAVIESSDERAYALVDAALDAARKDEGMPRRYGLVARALALHAKADEPTLAATLKGRVLTLLNWLMQSRPGALDRFFLRQELAEDGVIATLRAVHEALSEEDSDVVVQAKLFHDSMGVDTKAVLDDLGAAGLFREMDARKLLSDAGEHVALVLVGEERSVAAISYDGAAGGVDEVVAALLKLHPELKSRKKAMSLHLPAQDAVPEPARRTCVGIELPAGASFASCGLSGRVVLEYRLRAQKLKVECLLTANEPLTKAAEVDPQEPCGSVILKLLRKIDGADAPGESAAERRVERFGLFRSEVSKAKAADIKVLDAAGEWLDDTASLASYGILGDDAALMMLRRPIKANVRFADNSVRPISLDPYATVRDAVRYIGQRVGLPSETVSVYAIAVPHALQAALPRKSSRAPRPNLGHVLTLGESATSIDSDLSGSEGEGGGKKKKHKKKHQEDSPRHQKKHRQKIENDDDENDDDDDDSIFEEVLDEEGMGWVAVGQERQRVRWLRSDTVLFETRLAEQTSLYLPHPVRLRVQTPQGRRYFWVDPLKRLSELSKMVAQDLKLSPHRYQIVVYERKKEGEDDEREPMDVDESMTLRSIESRGRTKYHLVRKKAGDPGNLASTLARATATRVKVEHDNSGHVTRSTLAGIVSELMAAASKKPLERLRETPAVLMFLQTAPTYCSPEQLLDVLMARYHQIDPAKKRAAYNLVVVWMEQDFPQVKGEIGARLSDFLQLTASADGLVTAAEAGAMLEALSQSHAAPALTRAPGGGTEVPQLTEIAPKELAQQICLEDFHYFSRIQPHEFIRGGWKKPETYDRSPNLMAMVTRFNDLSNRVAGLIVSQRDFRRRREVLRHLVQVAEALHGYSNFASLASFLSAFTNAAINRLRWTRERQSSATLRALAELEAVMEMESSYRTYRAALAKSKPPAVPYLGVALFDITFIEDGNPDNLGGMINIEKRRMLYDAVSNVLSFAAAPYSFEPHPDSQRFLDRLPAFSDKELYSMSLEVEPRNCTLQSLM